MVSHPVPTPLPPARSLLARKWPLLVLSVLFEIFRLTFFSLSQGVSGGTASGKTTVCDMIIQQLHDHRVVLVNQVCVITAASAAGFVLVGETRLLLLLLLLLCLVEFCFAVCWFCLVCPKPCSLSSLKGGIIP